MSASVEAASSFAKDLLVSSLHRVGIEIMGLLKYIVLSPVIVISVLVSIGLYQGFNPALAAVLRAPLEKNFGLKFDNMKVRPHNLSIKMSDIVLPCSESSIVRGIILSVFPSAHVRKLEGHPESTVTVKYFSAKIRLGSIACACEACDQSQGDGNVDIELGKGKIKDGKRMAWIYRFIPKPYIRIKLQGMDIRVEKAYLAPKPPEFCTSKPPSALQDLDMSHLPTFEQDSMVAWLQDFDIRDANNVTYYIEQWIEHVKTKLKGGTESKADQPQDRTHDGKEDAGAQKPAFQTYDEKYNAVAKAILLIVLQSIIIHIYNVAIIITGSGSDDVKEMRKKHGPRHANFLFATMPRNKRAITIARADLLSLHFSPDEKCVGSLCFLGASLKVGHSVKGETDSESVAWGLEHSDSNQALNYDWHTIFHDFDLVADISGIIPIVIWAISYDHQWDTRSIGLTLTSSEMAFSLAPSHFHTALLHLDDWTDGNSPINGWFQWLMANFRRTLKTTEEEKLAYILGYEKMKQKKSKAYNKKAEQSPTATDIKELEKRMSCNEIISLRCIAMENQWKIPKATSRSDDELAMFLENSRSSIVQDDDISKVTFDEPLYSFQRVHSSALRALVGLIREKFSFLAPSLPIEYHCSVLHTDFPSDLDEIRKTIDEPIPSCIDSRDVSFSTELKNLIYSDNKVDSVKGARSWLNLNLNIRDLDWSVLTSHPHLPVSLDDSPIGILYQKHRHIARGSQALSLEVKISLEPTKKMDPHYFLAFGLGNTSLVVNPLPLLSALQSLALVSDLPMQAIEPDLDQVEAIQPDVSFGVEKAGNVVDASGDGVYLAMPNVVAEVSIECCSVIFLIDRLKLRRGILDFNVASLTIGLDMSAASATLTIRTEPFELCSGQHQHSDTNENWVLLPLKPIVLIDGVRVLLLVQEKGSERKINTTVLTSCSKMLAIRLEIGVDAFSINISPSAIIALSETANSFNPFLEWMAVDAAEEEKRIMMEKQRESEERRLALDVSRKALLEVFEMIDVDGSGSLQNTELAEVIRQMFENSSSGDNIPSQRLTAREVDEQTKYLMSILDPLKMNDISFQELDGLLFRVANEIDDINLAPKMPDDDDRSWVDYLSRTFKDSDFFLSGHVLRQLVHFEDLKEYASWHEVHRIVGDRDLVESLPFPAPNLWFEGGIEKFWSMYEEETGCARDGLNGQDMALVQQKLVRALCNYEFAKFCWRSLVQPRLQSKSEDGIDGLSEVSSWIIDSNTKIRNVNVIGRILDKITRKNEVCEKKGDEIIYNMSFAAAVNQMSLAFGSPHTFKQPLVLIGFSNIKTTAISRLGETFWFIPTVDETKESNKLSFQGMISAKHLNTRHDYMECLIEPYPCFGHATFDVFFEDTDTEKQAKGAEKTSFSVSVNCPRSMNINTSPSFFESAALLGKIAAESNPKSYRKWIIQRDIDFVHDFWNECTSSESDTLSPNAAAKALRMTLELHWRDEMVGLKQETKDKLIETVIGQAETDEYGMISFNDMEKVLAKVLSRCYFSGCKEVRIRNNCGRGLKVSTTHSTRLMRHSVNDDDFEVDDVYKSIQDGKSGSVILDESNDQYISMCRHELRGAISLSISGYRKVSTTITPYQSFMLALKHPKNSKRRRARKKNASGFTPYLTIVPQEGALPSMSFVVRTSVAIQSEHPVNIRIVRLPKSFGKSSQGKKLDLSKKKHLSAALQALVRGAQIVFEMKEVGGDVTVPIHLGVLDSYHHHALLVQDLNLDGWRHPVLLTKDFLFNSMGLAEVTRCHSMSGIIINRERLRVHHDRARSTQVEDVARATAWDTIIKVVPFFLLQNSMPYAISVRLWQLAEEEDEDDLWQDPSFYLGAGSSYDEDSSDDENSAMTPASQMRSEYLNQFHQSYEKEKRDFLFKGYVESCQMLRLSGISLRQPIFMEVSQSTKSCVSMEQTDFMWSSPLLLALDTLRTGANKKGSLTLPKLILDLGDEIDALVDVSIDSKIRMPACTIYSPYWITNKTGMKLEYRISGQSKKYLDSGVGGLPVMIHGAKSIETNTAYKKVSRQISVIPLESPKDGVIKHWWDDETNGKLVLKNIAINNHVDWSDNLELDAVGTSGELVCKQVVLNTSIDSLAGAFHRSNLVTLSPRYVVKNLLHISITVMALCGSQKDVIKKSLQLRENPSAYDERAKLILKPGESTILYSFQDVSFEGVDNSRRWLAFCVNAARSRGGHMKAKWHLVPTDSMDQFHFGEHDALDTMCGILEAKVHTSVAGSMLLSISHSAIPPYRIENRSVAHSIQFVQDDNDATVFELPPMHSCGYTWDSPLGKRELMAVIVSKTNKDSFPKPERSGGKIFKEDDETASLALSDALSVDQSDVSYSTNGDLNKKKEAQRTSKFKRFFTGGYKSYSMTKPGRQNDLPKKSSKEWGIGSSSPSLFAHMRIMGGTKILSFNDSDWLAQQVEQGNLRKGGGFKHAETDLFFEGLSFCVIDDFNHELLGITVRDVQIQKPRGLIEATLRVRHFQVDAMLPSARYPIIIQPLPLGVDRREPLHHEPSDVSDSTVDVKDLFWESHGEKPIPVLELTSSYVPQTNMTWIPSLSLMVCPCKVEIDIDYILRVAGVVINSASKFQDGSKNIVSTSTANDKLEYLSRGQQSGCLTYIEKLYIAPVYFQIELNIKPDDSDDSDDYETLTLNAIAQSTNSASVAGILSWVINVGANFAHVSPCFRYPEIIDSDRYCDAVDLATDVAMSYVVKTIKQCYKVVFSMHLLGDPSQYAHQVKTGVTDLVLKTRDEIAAGGKDGVGQGVASFSSNVVGGFFVWGGRLTGGFAGLLDSIVTTEHTSNHLKAKSDGKTAENVVEGLVQGTEYLSRTIVHGAAGIVGNPYRGMKSGGVVGFTKGAASGVAGAFFAPFIGALGFVAKTAEGVGESSKMLNIAVIEARCRPARSVLWGKPMIESGISFLKGIGIRVHTVRYQKVRKKMIQKEGQDVEISSKELKRIRAAEERRKNPPHKAISIIHNKQRQHYLTNKVKPKLLPDGPGNLILSHYAVVFEETVVLRTTDLQLSDQVMVNFWNYKGLKIATTKSKPLACCKLNVSDIYWSMVQFYRGQLARKEKCLSDEVSFNSAKEDTTSISLNIPAPQEFCLFRPCKTTYAGGDILEAVRDEITAIQKKEDVFDAYDSDSNDDPDSDHSFLGGSDKKMKKDDPLDSASANERLFGTISLSFFPIPW